MEMNRPSRAPLTADQVAGLFAQRLPETGGWISSKQIDWLLATFARENRIPRSNTATGALTDGREWTAHKSGNRNGAGTLHFVSAAARKADLEAAQAKRVYEDACRIVNEQVIALMDAGRTDEIRPLLERFAAEHKSA
jgi:hypothetical protein